MCFPNRSYLSFFIKDDKKAIVIQTENKTDPAVSYLPLSHITVELWFAFTANTSSN